MKRIWYLVVGSVAGCNLWFSFELLLEFENIGILVEPAFWLAFVNIAVMAWVVYIYFRKALQGLRIVETKEG